jgi:hypothetical protein
MAEQGGGKVRDGSGRFAPQNLALHFAGAPLDVVKLAAAAFMLTDHVNTVLLKSTVPLMWRFGRIAFPLFCFVLACHLARGSEPRRYAALLLLLAIPTQPVFGAAFQGELGNVLFTLAAGAALAGALLRADSRLQHAVLAIGAGVVFAWPLRARSGVDFGLGGILLPAAITLTLAASRMHAIWLAILLIGLNTGGWRPLEESFWAASARDAAFAAVGGALVLALAAMAQGRPRFLPRYALHVFYPGHLLALALLREAGFVAT